MIEHLEFQWLNWPQGWGFIIYDSYAYEKRIIKNIIVDINIIFLIYGLGASLEF